MNKKFQKAVVVIGALAVISLVVPFLTGKSNLTAATEVRLTKGVDVRHPALGQNFIVWQEYRGGEYNLYLYDFDAKKETKINTVALSSELVGPVVFQNHVYWVDHPAEGWVIYDYNVDHFIANKYPVIGNRVYSLSVYENFLIMEAQNGSTTDILLMNKESSKVEAINITNDQVYQTAPDIYGNYATWAEFTLGCTAATAPASSVCQPAESGNIVTYDLVSGQKVIVKANLRQLSNVKIHNLALAWSQIENDNLVVKVHYMNTGTTVTVSPTDYNSYNPELSGDLMTYYVRRANGVDLELYQFSNGKHTTLSWTQVEKSEVALGPSTRYVAWLDNRMGSKDIFYFDSQAEAILDQDGDGLTDAEEQKAGTLAYAVDTDNDGLTDYEEVKRYKTYPAQYDSDGDGLTDGQEINNWLSDPKKFDSNQDGIDDKTSVSQGYNPMANRSKLFVYRTPRMESLAEEKQLAQLLKNSLDKMLGRGRWRADGRTEWFKVVNAYIYGGYNVKEVAGYVTDNPYAISGDVLAIEWRESNVASGSTDSLYAAMQ